MLMNDTITTYTRKGKVKNQKTGKYEDIAEGQETRICNVSVVRDYVDNVQFGRVTGKTIKVRLINPVTDFTVAEWNGREYKKVGVKQSGNFMSVEMEEV